jgi:hypothetical protein
MANEGIMSLPGGMGMPAGKTAEQQPPSVTSADSYDAAQTALGMVDPQAVPAMKDAIRQAIGDLQLTPEQVDLLIQIFEYVSQNPGEYKNLVQKMIEAGAVDKGEFPEEYDPQFIGAFLMVLHEMQQMQGQGAMEPANLSPIVEGLQPMGMAEGGLADVASYLASQGRGGDSILAHITPEEAAMLKRRGGSGTVNPMTGLPEFKGGVIGGIVDAVSGAVKSVVNVVKDVLKSPVGRILGTVALATVLGPAGVGLSMGTAAGLAGAGTTLIAGGSMKDALVAGALGYVGGGGTIMGVNPVASVGQYLPGVAGGALNTGLATGLMGAGIGKIAGMSTADALKLGLTSGATAGALKALGPAGTPAEGTPAEGTGRFAGANEGAPSPTDQGIGGLKTAASSTGVGAPGQIGTAQDILGGGLKAPAMGPSMSYDPMSGSFKPDYSLMPQGAPSAPGMEGAMGSGLRMPTSPMTGAPGMGDAMGAGLRPNTAFGPADYSVAAGGKGLATNYSLTPAAAGPAAAAQPSGFVDSMVQGAKNLYNEYLSPSRPGLASDAGIFTKYGPLAAAGTAVIAATGGMNKGPSNPNPVFNRNYTGWDYMKDNPEKFQGGLDFSYTKPTTPQNPVVQQDFSSAIPVSQPGKVIPMGATMSPGGVAQPYNVAGLYGVPLIYQVPGRARGGEMSMTEFPRKNGPISGPGTGTSDDIPAMLSDGEFVFTAKAVRNAGGGSRRKGAARMYKLMKKLEGGPVKG